MLIKPLTQQGFAPYGDVIESEGRKSFFINNDMAERFHNLAKVDVLGEDATAIISLVHSKQFDMPRKVDHVENHPLGSQAFLPLDDSPFIVVVGKEGEAPKVNELEAFVTNGQQGINYHAGTWHHVLLTPYSAMRFICVDRIGSGDNCIDYFIDEVEQQVLGLPELG
jgi:ureidoglycolate lyase